MSTRLVLRACTALLLAACAPARGTGGLSPVTARVTNEVVARDQATLDRWAARLADASDRTRGAAGHDYAVARAAAWLGYARDAYAWNPRDGAADAAFAEARRLVTALEAGVLADTGTPPMLGAARVRPDLWEELARSRDGDGLRRGPVAVADAEVALVRASHLASAVPEMAGTAVVMTAYDRACELELQVTRAERAIASLRRPPSTVAVVQQGAALVVAHPAPVATAFPLTRVVHFALNSSRLAPASRQSIAAVAALLRAHPGVNVVIEGYTDARGDSARNRALATRRADAVRRALEAASLPLGRVSVAGVGTAAEARSHATRAAFARDRRVTLAFTDTAGVPLTVELAKAIDASHERDLQVERERGGRATSRPPRRATTGRSGVR